MAFGPNGLPGALSLVVKQLHQGAFRVGLLTRFFKLVAGAIPAVASDVPVELPKDPHGPLR